MIAQVRRPPVGGGSHADEEDRYPAAQRDQPAGVQEGTEGFKVTQAPWQHSLLRGKSLSRTTPTSLLTCYNLTSGGGCL